jgi:hypothetical protein
MDYQTISFTMILLGILGWLANDKMKTLSSKVTACEENINKIQFNYINRFDEIKDSINKNHKETLAAISKIEINCAAFNHKVE